MRKFLVMNDFALRQFHDPNYVGTKINSSVGDFMKRIEEFPQESLKLVDGYAPFCKHIFIPNFDETITVGTLPITPDNEHLLKSAYKARTEKELPVLVRWFPKEAVTAPPAKYLDLILYSAEQIHEESRAMKEPAPTEAFEWGIISIKGQLEDHETPMTPITMMRNALGKAEGGSGVTLDVEAYRKSVQYHSQNAMIV